MRAITKTDFLIYLECAKNAWIKIHKPDVYASFPESEFEKSLGKIGDEVEAQARKLFPKGILVEGRDEAARQKTQSLIMEKTPAIFQPVFAADGFLAAADVLQYDEENNAWNVYEIKATNSTRESGDRSHIDDIAFQKIVLERAGLPVGKCFIIHLNSEYVRRGEIDLQSLFASDDVTEKAQEKADALQEDMARAKAYLSQADEPSGYCSCIYRGRSGHCTTFKYSNKDIPDYGIHDLTRIGASKAKLRELANREIWSIDDIPDDMTFSENQQAQIDAYRHGSHRDTLGIRDELDSLAFPLYFLDYETFPAAIPRYDAYSPYQHIPFQFSLHILDRPDGELAHVEFLHTDAGDPNPPLIDMMKRSIGPKGSVIVWHKSFECSKNNEMAKRYPEHAAFLADVNARVYDLEDVFTSQYLVEKDFKGKTSIKYVLPVLVPELSYKGLEIRNGQMAMEQWDKIARGEISGDDMQEVAINLKEYCKLDTYAMYAIWKKLYEMAYR